MEWIKAFHIISVISWMAGLLYLPRLFIYHVDAEVGSVQSETFKTMERRLYRAIMTPAMAASWIFGLWLLVGFDAFDFASLWSWLKIVGVVALTGVHGFLGICRRQFADDANTRSAKFFRLINEVPTVLMLLIVIMVVVRPF